MCDGGFAMVQWTNAWCAKHDPRYLIYSPNADSTLAIFFRWGNRLREVQTLGQGHTARDREAGLEQGPSGLEDQGLGILPVWWLWSLPRNLINQLKPTYTSFTGTKKLDSCHCLQSSWKSSSLFVCLFVFAAACGHLLLWPGIEPTPLALEAWSFNHWTAREDPRKSLSFGLAHISNLSPHLALSLHLNSYPTFHFRVQRSEFHEALCPTLRLVRCLVCKKQHLCDSTALRTAPGNRGCCLHISNISIWGISLVVQWLRLCTANAGGVGSIPGLGTKIPHAMWNGQKAKFKKNQYMTKSLPTFSCFLILLAYAFKTLVQERWWRGEEIQGQGHEKAADASSSEPVKLLTGTMAINHVTLAKQ